MITKEDLRRIDQLIPTIGHCKFTFEDVDSVMGAAQALSWLPTFRKRMEQFINEEEKKKAEETEKVADFIKSVPPEKLDELVETKPEKIKKRGKK